MVFKKPIRVVLEKHETEYVWNVMVIGGLWGQCPLGCVQWLLRSKGAKLVQACPCSLSGGLPPLKQSWAVPGSALGMARHTPSSVGYWGCQYWVCPVTLSCLSGHLYWESLPKPENEITSLFLSFLHFKFPYFRLPHSVKGGPWSPASYCWQKLAVLVISKRKLVSVGDWSDPVWSIANVIFERKDS